MVLSDYMRGGGYVYKKAVGGLLNMLYVGGGIIKGALVYRGGGILIRRIYRGGWFNI